MQPKTGDSSYQVIARKWRPGAFKEVIGQDHVVRTLSNAVNSGRIGHAFIFSGPRGVGKTTIARILARCLNCAEGPTAEPCLKCSFCTGITGGSLVDVLEIDGASNNSVENVRELCESVRYAPASARYKIYIIDEVHMLSASAFNALLKTLEEPPPH
ncbi:DNA polymerase III subunits gamma and tau, partial [hydrothermal vent metagenome]